MQLFCGRLPPANRFIVGTALLSLSIFWSCDTLRFCGVRAARRNCSQYSFLGRGLATLNRATIQ